MRVFRCGNAGWRSMSGGKCDRAHRLQMRLLHDVFQWLQYGVSIHCFNTSRINVDIHRKMGTARFLERSSQAPVSQCALVLLSASV